MTELALAVVAGALIGLSLGALGGGGSILAVPVLLALGQSPAQATTGSLVVVGVTSLAGAPTTLRCGSALGSAPGGSLRAQPSAPPRTAVKTSQRPGARGIGRDG